MSKSLAAEVVEPLDFIPRNLPAGRQGARL